MCHSVFYSLFIRRFIIFFKCCFILCSIRGFIGFILFFTLFVVFLFFFIRFPFFCSLFYPCKRINPSSLQPKQPKAFGRGRYYKGNIYKWPLRLASPIECHISYYGLTPTIPRQPATLLWSCPFDTVSMIHVFFTSFKVFVIRYITYLSFDYLQTEVTK